VVFDKNAIIIREKKLRDGVRHPGCERIGEIMTEDTTSRTTKVTKVKDAKDGYEPPLMSYTAVTSHQAMAEAFMSELIRIGNRIMPDHSLTVTDLFTICHVALDKVEKGVVMLEGRHLRARIGEQISRADRYKEPFSLLILKFDESVNTTAYDALVDTLCERMRKTDLMFLFKSRVVLLLPHTIAPACLSLSKRIRELLSNSSTIDSEIDFAMLTYPSPKIRRATQVLDWAEDHLRT
jgi:hypothetical protein